VGDWLRAPPTATALSAASHPRLRAPPQLQPAGLIALPRPFPADKAPARRETVAAAAAGDASSPEPAKKFMGYDSFTWSKIAALGAMFFCILFNYTILRDTKARAPRGGAAAPCMDTPASRGGLRGCGRDDRGRCGPRGGGAARAPQITWPARRATRAHPTGAAPAARSGARSRAL
jgi:hypothetical protein